MSVKRGDFQFTLKPTWYGIVVMFREAGFDCDALEYWNWTPWRKATWKDMVLFDKEHLK